MKFYLLKSFILSSLLLVACNTNRVIEDISDSEELETFKPVATYDTNNELLWLKIKKVLDAEGIENYSDGSVISSIFVREEDLEKVKAIFSRHKEISKNLLDIN